MGCACSKQVEPADALPTRSGAKSERLGSNLHNNKGPKDRCIAVGVIAGLPSQTGPKTLQSEVKPSVIPVLDASVQKQPKSRQQEQQQQQQSAEALPKHQKPLRHGASKQNGVC